MPQQASFTKAPSETLDYCTDWGSGTYPGPWLAGGDTIEQSSWTVPSGLTVASESFTASTASVWLSGGQAGRNYTITNTVTTAQGRTGSRSFTLVCSATVAGTGAPAESGAAWNPSPAQYEMLLAQLEATLGALYASRGNNLSDLASESAARENLGLGSAATLPSTAFDPSGSASSAESAATAAAHSDAASQVATETARAEAAESLAALKANNLSDLPSPATARTNLGLGSAAVQPASAFASLVGGTVPRGQLPNISGSVWQSVANQAAMLALVAPDPDTMLIVYRADTQGYIWFLNPGLNPTVLSNWNPVQEDAAGAASAAQAAAIAAAHTDAASQVGTLQASLPGVYAPIGEPVARALPAAAPTTSSGRFDPARSLYGKTAATAAKMRACLAKARSGGVGSVLLIGASLSHGYYGSAAYFAPNVYGPAAILRSRLLAAGLSSRGSGWLQCGASPGLAASDSRIVVAGANAAGGLYVALGANATLTFTAGATDAAAAVDLLLGTASTGSLSVTVNGVAGPTFTPAGGVSWQKYTAALAITSGQTVVLTQGNSGTTYVQAIRLRAAAGIEISDAALSGSTTGAWLPTAAIGNAGAAFTTAIMGETPDVVLIGADMFVNDYVNGGVTVAQSLANMSAIISYWQNAGAGVVLWCPYNAASVPSATWLALVAGLYQLADSKGVMLIDGTDRNPYASAAALGYIGPDNTHLTRAGYADEGNHLNEVLAA